MANQQITGPHTNISIIVTRHNTRRFLRRVNFFINTATKHSTTGQITTMKLLWPTRFTNNMNRHFIPTSFLPQITSILASRQFNSTVQIHHMAPNRPTLSTKVTIINLAIFIQGRTRRLITLRFNTRQTTSTTVNTHNSRTIFKLTRFSRTFFRRHHNQTNLRTDTTKRTFKIRRIITANYYSPQFGATPNSNRNRHTLNFFTNTRTTITSSTLTQIMIRVQIKHILSINRVIITLMTMARFTRTSLPNRNLWLTITVNQTHRTIRQIVKSMRLRSITPRHHRF